MKNYDKICTLLSFVAKMQNFTNKNKLKRKNINHIYAWLSQNNWDITLNKIYHATTKMLPLLHQEKIKWMPISILHNCFLLTISSSYIFFNLLLADNFYLQDCIIQYSQVLTTYKFNWHNYFPFLVHFHGTFQFLLYFMFHNALPWIVLSTSHFDM